jgi:septum formation protein
MELILASGSPRRRELLAAAGFAFRVVVSPAEELHDAAIEPGELCMLNAAAKAEAVAACHRDALVIGADTLVFLDAEPLGKPGSLDDARAMLRRLSGRTHQVRTGCALCHAGLTQRFVVTTEVDFQVLDEAAIEAYLGLVNVLDKAGSYAVQEHGERVVAAVRGSFDNVVGLPVAELAEELGRRGVLCG